MYLTDVSELVLGLPGIWKPGYPTRIETGTRWVWIPVS